MTTVCPTCRKLPCLMCELTDIQKKLEKQSPYVDERNLMFSKLPNNKVLVVDGFNLSNQQILDPDYLRTRQPDDYLYDNFLLPPDPIVYLNQRQPTKQPVMAKSKQCY